MTGRDAVDGLRARHLQIEADILVGGIEQRGTFEPQHAAGHIVQTVVATAEIVANHGTLPAFKRVAVELHGGLVVFSGKSAVGSHLEGIGIESRHRS